MRLYALAVASLLSVSSAASAQLSSPPTGTPDEQLELTVSKADHLAGTYVRGATRVRFDVQRTAAAGVLELRSGSNRVLLRGTIDKQSISMSILDGRLTVTGPTPKDAKSLPPLESRGDAKALEELKESAEYRLLPFLSRALGARGITGRSHPASLGLHFLGMASAMAHKVQLPPLGQAEARSKAEAEDGTACYDQRNDPCNDDCFGMCGANCSCWSWVCGDCCVNTNCLLHDTYCSKCQCGQGSCFLCYIPLTVLIPFPSPGSFCQYQSDPCPNQAACNCTSMTSCSQISGTACGWCVAQYVPGPGLVPGTNVARYGSSNGPNQGKCKNWIWDHKDCDCATIAQCPQIEGTHCGWCSTICQAMPGSSSGPKYQPSDGTCKNNWTWKHQDCPSGPCQ